MPEIPFAEAELVLCVVVVVVVVVAAIIADAVADVAIVVVVDVVFFQQRFTKYHPKPEPEHVHNNPSASVVDRKK